jgi:hypothetical protein
VGGVSASTTASEYAEAPPTPDPSPPRAARAEGGGEESFISRYLRHCLSLFERRGRTPVVVKDRTTCRANQFDFRPIASLVTPQRSRNRLRLKAKFASWINPVSIVQIQREK